MVFGPLTGACFNPARWFGPALIGDFFARRHWPFVVGPIVGATRGGVFYRFVIAGPQYAEGSEPPTSQSRRRPGAQGRRGPHVADKPSAPKDRSRLKAVAPAAGLR